MTLLSAGVLVWILVHLVPGLFTGLRGSIIEKIGKHAYRGLVALGVLGGIGLVIAGWRSSAVVPLYEPLPLAGWIAFVLILPAFILFAAFRSNIKRFIRHPQLLGMTLWSSAHLLVNGDGRSAILFGGLLFWSLLMMWLLNRRDGAWQKPAPVSLTGDAIALLIGINLFIALLFSHVWLFGVSPLDVL